VLHNTGLETLAREKHSSLVDPFVICEEKSFIIMAPGERKEILEHD
jgi:hypothetical protein